MRQYLEVELKESVDPFEVQQYLTKYTTMKVHVIDNNSIRVWFNDIRITPARVVKLVSQATKATA
jgi:hypothetical protein